MDRINSQYYTKQQYPGETETRWNVSGIAHLASTLCLTYIHECGHAVAAQLLYDNAEPQISLFREYFYISGKCEYNASNPNSLGKWMGPSNSTALVSAAGPIVDIISMLAITKLSRSNRKAAELMALKAVNLSLYAISALWNNSPSHDFSNVWSKGGFLAYGLLSTCCFATTAIVLHNATKPIKKKEQNLNDRHQGFARPKQITALRSQPISYRFL